MKGLECDGCAFKLQFWHPQWFLWPFIVAWDLLSPNSVFSGPAGGDYDLLSCLSGRQGHTGNLINSFCLEMLAGMPGHQVIQMLDKGYRLPQPETCPRDLYELMLKCWSTEPSERPTFETLYCQLEDYFDNDSCMNKHATIKWTPRQGQRKKCNWMCPKGNKVNPRWRVGCEDKEDWYISTPVLAHEDTSWFYWWQMFCKTKHQEAGKVGASKI